MAIQEIEVSKRDHDTVKIKVDVPESMEEFYDRYGEEYSLKRLQQAFMTDNQNQARAHYESGPDAMQAAVDSYVPGQRGPRGPRDPLKAATNLFGKLDEAGRQQLLKLLQDKLAA